MIDWVSAVLPYPHDRLIHGGARIFVTPDGEHSAPLPQFASVEGSHDARCVIQTSREHPNRTHIYVSGSPKFLQGHNLFGTDDPRALVTEMAVRALDALGLRICNFQIAAWMKGRGVQFTRIDTTQMLDLESETNAALFMEAVATTSNLAYRGRGENRNGTVYFGKHSRRWSLKLYRKAVELQSRKKAHQLPPDILHRDRLEAYALGTVRAELTLRSMELKRFGLHNAEKWNHETALRLWEAHMKSLNISRNVTLHPRLIEKLPAHLRSSYSLWSAGSDVRALLPARTFSRHRKAILGYGVDISCPRSANEKTPVFTLAKVIQARPKQVPQWAYGTPLLAAA